MKHCYLFLVALLFVSTGYGQENILLEEYMPKSIYKIPETKVEKAKYPVIDAHSHDYPSSLEEVAQWVKTICVVQTASIPLTHRFSFFEIPACLLSSGL